jgi:pSer/pThr/pTyr-binding forkhead associated (FHA) protein
VVSDLGSLNGSYVNRDRIDSEVTLTGGDEVQIGKYRLIYFAGSSKGQA